MFHEVCSELYTQINTLCSNFNLYQQDADQGVYEVSFKEVAASIMKLNLCIFYYFV